ncbi:MAG: hypothetical protein U1E76_24455 [Planctomycetota bacterium]
MNQPPVMMHRTWMALLAIGIGALALLLIRDRAYYLAPVTVQAAHPRHSLLRSSASVGLALGLCGLSLMTFNLLYLVRRALLNVRFLGALRSWMGFHVMTGLLGAGCIALHSGLNLRSATATIAMAAMAIVVMSGLIGRYLYTRVPRSFEGRLLQFDEVQRSLREHVQYLRELGITSLDEAALAGLDGAARRRGLLASLLRLIHGELALARRHRRVIAELVRLNVPAAGLRQTRDLLALALRERVWLTRFRELTDLMASWRFVHRWLALLMLCTAAVHVVLAVTYADLRWPWIAR